MNRTEIATVLETLPLDLERIAAADVKASVVVLLNLVETLAAENEKLREEQQKLKDEINRLKGEQGKPEIKGKTRKRDDLSSEQERKEAAGGEQGKGGRGERQRESKREQIKIDRVQVCPVNGAELPEDAIFKGYESVIVQDLKITTDNVEYRRAVYYSPSQKKTYRGALPPEVKGEFGAGIRALIPTMKPVCNLSEPKIVEFLQNFGVRISAGYISGLLSDPQAVFHREKDELYRTGLECGDYQQIDDTSARVNGENHYTQVVCNPLYTAYFTTEHKDRLSVLDVLRNFAPRRFLFNSETMALLEQFRLSQKLIGRVDSLEKDQPLTEAQITKLLDELQPGPQQRSRLLEAAAIAAYHQETELPVVKLLLCDDAPQFKLLTEELALCWVHDGRHYKKLNPIVPAHRQQWESFRQDYWAFYGQLLQFKQTPTSAEAARLSAEFDRLFSTQTGYAELDERIAKTLAKKAALLVVLRHPQLPLHNNDAELGARAQARVRDVSLHTKSKAGTQAKDTFMTIVQTAKKLGVSAYDYIYDRVSGKFELPSLAQLIREKRKAELHTCPDPP
jgi:cell division protein FtsB